jgi:8-oxo-dGTP pyrophosphatase MutT (NUDIX family)
MATRGVFAAIFVNVDYLEGNPPAILLLQRNGNPDGSGYPNQWELPGGRAQEGESDEDCLKRVVYEKTGIQVELIGKPLLELGVGPGIVTDQSDVSCIYLCREQGGSLKDFPTQSHKAAYRVTVAEIFRGDIQVGCPNPTSKGYVSRMMEMILAAFRAHKAQMEQQ